MLTRILGICFLIIANFIVINIVKASPVETFEFQDEVTKVRFQALSKELRCPKCQNQNLADSNSTVASALRLDLYNLLIEGRSDAEIIDLMVGRYGEFVLYRPRVSSVTYILWFGPPRIIDLNRCACRNSDIKKKTSNERKYSTGQPTTRKIKTTITTRAIRYI